MLSNTVKISLIKFENGNIYVDADGIEHYPLFVSAFTDLLMRKWDGPEF